MLASTVSTGRLDFSCFAADNRLKENLFARCSVSCKQLTTALGYACISKVSVGFRNLQLVYDSCSAQGRSVTSRIGGARLCDATGHAHFISQISQPHTSCLRSTYLHMGKKLSHAYLKTEWCIRGSLEN